MLFRSVEEMKNKLDEQKKQLDMKDSTIFFISAKNLRLKIRLRSIREKLAEYARRGSMKAVCYNLQKAADSGLLENKNTLKGMLETVARNFHVEKNGKRYQAPFKLFLEVLLQWGGPRIANFVADRKSTRLNSSHANISYAVFCLKKKKKQTHTQ